MPTELRGDPSRLRQILINLVGNAVKFTEAGEVVVRAELQEEDVDSATIRFEVSDTGIGITPEHRERLFESFSQADTSTTRRHGGTGLGLAISAQLVGLMGGEIGVESKPGAGSTFWFTVPLEEQPKTAQQYPAPRENLRGLKVLVADPNSTNRSILQKQLGSWDMSTGEAENGSGTLEELRAAAANGESYDLVVLDTQLPEMEGMKLAQGIKNDPTLYPTHLVLVTSMGQRGDAEAARETGIEAYLTKPIRQSELYDTLTIVMGFEEYDPESDGRFVTRHTVRELKAGDRTRLLLAEDNEVNQKVAVRKLEKLGYRVDVADNGVEALNALERCPYAAVLMDCQMPELDGYAAASEIRRRENEEGSEHHTPIIAMTANALQGDREKALEAGMNDYVSKPVASDVLDETLKRWVSQVSPEAPGPRANGSADSRNGEAVLDPAVLEGLRELQQDGEPDILEELFGMFLEDAETQISKLEEAVGSGDPSTVLRAAHTLKGSNGNIGAHGVSRVCAGLEEAERSENLDKAKGLLRPLKEEFLSVRSALDMLIPHQARR